MSVFEQNIKSTKRIDWLKQMMEICSINYVPGDSVNISFKDLDKYEIAPEHAVSFACMVEALVNKGVSVAIETDDPCGKYFYDNLHLKEYWINEQDYFPAGEDTILNLWHIKEEQIEEHARRITNYLKSGSLKHKDLSSVTNSLLEAYYNIIDHSKSEGNAFSMISFNKNAQILNVAVCDFGIGIAKSVRDYDATIVDDKTALRKAAETNFTVRSAKHNAGMGLYNIRCVCTEDDDLWIISNRAALRLTNDNERATDLDFMFNGCLLAYSVSLSRFSDEETLDDFNWILED